MTNLHASPRSTPFRTLFLAQESGLVLVIALIMVLLTAFSGSKPQREVVKLPVGTVITAPQGPVMTVQTPRGNAQTYDVSRGWSVKVLQDTSATLTRTTRANKFLNPENLVQVLVFSSFIAIMAVGITAVIVMGGIDLSIGSIYALAALLGAIALRYNFARGFPTPMVRGSALLAGVLATGAVFAAVAGVVAGKRASGAKVDASGTRAQFARASLLSWAVTGVLVVIVGWALLRAMRDADTTARSQLGLAGALPLAVLVCCSVGTLAGLVNGLMVVWLRVHPFIITLGTMAAYRGLVALPTQAQSVGSFPESLQRFIKYEVAGVTPVPVILTVLVALAGMFVLTRTVLGRRVFAIGGNETAAAYAGIPVGRVKVIVHTLMGTLAGLAGFLYLGYFGAAETNAGSGYELKAIAAAVIGGASLAGGRGSAVGAVLGAILVGLIDNGILMLGIDQNYNQIILGGAIIAAVVLDQLKSRLTGSGARH